MAQEWVREGACCITQATWIATVNIWDDGLYFEYTACEYLHAIRKYLCLYTSAQLITQLNHVQHSQWRESWAYLKRCLHSIILPIIFPNWKNYQHFFFAICVSFSCQNKSVIYAVHNFTLRFLVNWLYPCLDCCGSRCSTCVSWASVLLPDPCWRMDSRVDTLTGETTAFLSLAPNTTCVQFTPL